MVENDKIEQNNGMMSVETVTPIEGIETVPGPWD